MHHEFWHDRWGKEEIGFHQYEINSHLTRFWHRLELPPHSEILVPLCGKSLDMLWLRDQGHRVLGVELSEKAVGAFFTENQLVPAISREGSFSRYSSADLTLLCGDFFALTAQHLVNTAAVYDRASLIALPPAMRQDYVEHLRATLPPAVPILLVTINYQQEQMQGPPFSVSAEEVASLYGEYYEISNIFNLDLMETGERARWQDRGIFRMEEQVYLLSAK